MGWGMLWLFVALKVPLLTLCWLVWWAIRQVPEPDEAPSDDGGRRVGPRPHPRPPLPHAPRRGPHAEQAPAAPPRVRPLNARARTKTP